MACKYMYTRPLMFLGTEVDEKWISTMSSEHSTSLCAECDGLISENFFHATTRDNPERWGYVTKQKLETIRSNFACQLCSLVREVLENDGLGPGLHSLNSHDIFVHYYRSLFAEIVDA